MIRKILFHRSTKRFKLANQITKLVLSYFVNSGSERKPISKPTSCRFGNWARLALASRGAVIL